MEANGWSQFPPWCWWRSSQPREKLIPIDFVPVYALYTRQCMTPDPVDMSLRKQYTVSLFQLQTCQLCQVRRKLSRVQLRKKKKLMAALQEFLIAHVLLPAAQGIRFCIVHKWAVVYFIHCLICAYLQLALLYNCNKKTFEREKCLFHFQKWESYFSHLCFLFQVKRAPLSLSVVNK